MSLNHEQKKAIVTELAEVVGLSISAIAADYRGLTVSEMTELRNNARTAGVKMRVYRNTLARLAIKETPFACLHEILVGPVVLFFSQDEPAAAARLLRTFIKEHEQLEIKGLVIDGELLPPEKLKAIASLPSREEALTQLAVVLQAPITKFVRTLNEPVAQVVRVMGAVRDQKEAA